MKNRKGFTVIEGLVALTIVGIIAALIVGAIRDASRGSRFGRVKEDVVRSEPKIERIESAQKPQSEVYSDAQLSPAAIRMLLEKMAYLEKQLGEVRDRLVKVEMQQGKVLNPAADPKAETKKDEVSKAVFTPD